MSWTDIFPVLTDEMVEQYCDIATDEEKKEIESYFQIEKWINKQHSRHIVSTSIFWKNSDAKSKKLPLPTLDNLLNAHSKGLVDRFDPWDHYIKPLLVAATKRQAGVVFRVYLAKDLDFLIPDLLIAGCEVALMKHSSIAHNPGAMWRYLALEERKKLVTFIDADRALEADADIKRTEETHRAGFKFWRVPVWGEVNSIGKIAYRPIIGGQFGSCSKIAVKNLMKALIWHTKNKTISKYSNFPGFESLEIHGAIWPNYGFDEWFLLSCVYPRIVVRGILTFVSINSSSRFLPLDIEYTMWASTKSEMIYFGKVDDIDIPRLSKKKPRKSNRCVLLTGIWQVKTDNDVNLINEFCDYASTQDSTVEIKPVLHIRKKSLIGQLPRCLRKNAILWEGLSYNVLVQRSLLHAVCHGHQADWIWQADSDERVDFSSEGGLASILTRADMSGADYVPGDWVDRIPIGNILPKISKNVSLNELFPRTALAVKYFGKSRQAKIALHRRDCLTSIGNHDPEENCKVPTSWSVPIWHFKWHSDCRENQEDKLNADPNWQWSWEMEQCVHKLNKDTNDSVTADWSTLPKQAWLKTRLSWKRGAYPVK